MATLKNNFVSAKMNLDADERMLKKGEYRTASNIRIANSEGSNVGAIEKSLSNRRLTNLELGENVKTIGGVADEFEEKLYWLVKSDSGCYIIEYDTINYESSFILKDTRKNDNALSFNEDYLVTGIVIIIDTDNNNRFLIFTDNNTQPKCINIERAKTYGENGFDEEMILLIKKPPIDAPKIELTKTQSNNENNIEEKFLRFGYRYKYLDGEYSAISPLSEIAFEAKKFEYDFSTSTNSSMVNKFNRVKIYFNTGSKLVTDIELIFVECGKNIPYIIDKFNKKDKEWGDETTKFHFFDNNKIYKTLPEKQLFRLYDNVPLKAKALEVINNMIVFGNYTENYNLVDNNGDKIFVNLNLKRTSIPDADTYYSCKSNRDYEIAIAYLDEYGRMTTPFTSENNTVFVEPKFSNGRNRLHVEIKNKPPYWAKYYRFFIKQSKTDYDVIVPNIFYENDGFVWIKVNPSDIDKVKEGDFLIVKADTRKTLEKLIKTRVLEVEKKEKNFLETTESKDLKQLPGLYLKIKPSGFSIDFKDLRKYLFEGFDQTKLGYVPVKKSKSYIERAIFYGDGRDDISITGNYTGSKDKNFIVIISTAGEKDRFSVYIGSEVLLSDIEIIANKSYNLRDNISINFKTDTGHIYNDKWIIRAKSKNVQLNNISNYWSYFTYAVYEGPVKDVIEGGSIIKIKYNQSANHNQNVSFNFTASRRYANLEEWYYGDEIYKKFESSGIEAKRVRFRRGNVGSQGVRESETFVEVKSDGTGTVNMLIHSSLPSGGLNSTRINHSIEIHEFKSIPIFETEPKEENSDVFYEYDRTYKIENGYHSRYDEYDASQTAGTPAQLSLQFFNCFGWGNGFESIKIKDLFNANALSIQTRPSVAVENYRQNKRIASFTWGKQYEQSLNYNGLNEFNLAELNFKNLDDKYGAIQIIMAYNTDLDVWQEDKVHKALYNKTALYNQDGSSNVSKSNLIFDSIIPYAGEFGISTQPESLAAFGNYRYWVDAKRGVVVRKGQSGIEIITYGMRNWFRDFLSKNYKSKILGCFDPHYKQYTISLEEKENLPVYIDENEIFFSKKENDFVYYLKLNHLTGFIELNCDVKGTVNIKIEYGNVVLKEEITTEKKVLRLKRNDLTHSKAKISITPISKSVGYHIKNLCPKGEPLSIVFLVLGNTPGKKARVSLKLKEGESEQKIITVGYGYGIRSYSGTMGEGIFPYPNQEVEISVSNRGGDGFLKMDEMQGNKFGYCVEKSINTNDRTERNGILTKATYPTIETEGLVKKIKFNFKKEETADTLYLIWDFRTKNG